MSTKPKKAVDPTTKDGDPTYIQRVEDIFNRLITEINERIGTGDMTTTLIKESSNVVKTAALLDSEKRQADKAARKKLDAYNHASVISWARTNLSSTERRELVKALSALDQKGNILS